MVELLTVLLILGVLVAIVVPQLQSAQLRARRAEVRVNTAGLHTAFQLYVASDAGADPLNSGYNPSPQPSALGIDGTLARAWNSGISPQQEEVWGRLGWSPDGAVHCSYQVYSAGAAVPGDFWTLGECDLDDAGRPLQRLMVGPTTSEATGLRQKGAALPGGGY